MSFATSIQKTTFFKKVFEINHKFLFDHMKDSIKSPKSHMDIGTESEKYAKKILFQLIDLTESIDNLEIISTFFSIKNIPKFYLNKGISEINYYKYHLENHYIKINSIIDFTSNFINEVFRLGIPTRKCNVYSILENLNTKETDCAKILKKFEKHFEKIKRSRNIIIHEGKHESEEIKSIDSKIISLEGFDTQLIIDYFKKEKQIAITTVLSKIKQSNNDAAKFLLQIAEALRQPFIHNYEYLKLLDFTPLV